MHCSCCCCSCHHSRPHQHHPPPPSPRTTCFLLLLFLHLHHHSHSHSAQPPPPPAVIAAAGAGAGAGAGAVAAHASAPPPSPAHGPVSIYHPNTTPALPLLAPTVSTLGPTSPVTHTQTLVSRPFRMLLVGHRRLSPPPGPHSLPLVTTRSLHLFPGPWPVPRQHLRLFLSAARHDAGRSLLPPSRQSQG